MTVTAKRLPRRVCPECGCAVFEYYRRSWTNDGDVEPAASCTSPDCDFWY
jgi:predicted  nucleic acid-binding Zn-ribbon protein